MKGSHERLVGIPDCFEAVSKFRRPMKQKGHTTSETIFTETAAAAAAVLLAALVELIFKT
jgi:hypothetical protein